MQTRHDPAVARTRDEGLPAYQARCTCGYRSVPHATRRMAEWEISQHVAGLPRVPADQQCRDRRAHRRPVWEACPLCAGQLSIDLEEGLGE
ncbi:MAG TPA: hypothetical protein VKY91_02975 [Vulgatibacteraceae bacterium]|nr:hypothetical protein [Vulgatibacteraceae bacterium]